MKQPTKEKQMTTKTVTLPASTLMDGLASVQRCVSTDVTRPHLCSVLVRRQPTSIVFVATDGHRLVTRTAEGIEAGKAFDVCLPGGKPVKQLIAFLKNDKNGKVTLEAKGARIKVSAAHGEMKLVGPPTDDYPEYEKVFKEGTKARRSKSKVVRLNPKYLADVGAIFGGCQSVVVRNGATPADPVTFEGNSVGVGVTLLLMPMREPKEMS